MPFVIRDKLTGDIVKMCSGKSVWSKVGHAKAAFATSGCYVREADTQTIQKWGGWGGKFGKFDAQERLEIVEAKVDVVSPSDQLGVLMMRLAKAEELLAGAGDYLEDVHAGESRIAEEIREYFREVE